jgi:hypothetical protein
MSYKSIITYTKPNAEIALHTVADEYLNLIDTYFDAGKITQKPLLVTTEGGIKATYTTIFNSLGDHNEFVEESLSIDNINRRKTYCTNNSINIDSVVDAG